MGSVMRLVKGALSVVALAFSQKAEAVNVVGEVDEVVYEFALARCILAVVVDH